MNEQQIIAAALTTLDTFVETFNAGDARGHCETFAYPHVRLASGEVRVWQSIDEAVPRMQRAMDRLREHEWDHSEWDHRRMVQIGESKVHLDVQFRRFRADKSVIGVFPAIYVVVDVGGEWLIQCRSSFAP
jgi:hypothetical protein